MPLITTFGSLSRRALRGGSAKTLLLCHFDGSNGSTTFTDSSFFNRSVTRANSGAAISTTSPALGTGSLALASNDILTTADSFSLPGDFCFDIRLKFTTVSIESGANRRIIQSPFPIYIETNGKLTLQGTGGLTSTNAFNSGAWVALRLERIGSTVTMYKDGASEGSGTNSGAYSGVLTLGALTASSGRFAGNMDELCIRAAARDGGAYTPSGSEFSAD